MATRTEGGFRLYTAAELDRLGLIRLARALRRESRRRAGSAVAG